MNIRTNMLMVALAITSVSTVFTSCKKDEMKPPTIGFKTGAGYTSADASIAAGTAIMIGIDAAKSAGETEDMDVLNHFNISLSVNGATATSVYDADMTTAEEDDYSYDYNTTAGATVGDTNKYTFTITNRDGVTAQVSLTVTSL